MRYRSIRAHQNQSKLSPRVWIMCLCMAVLALGGTPYAGPTPAFAATTIVVSPNSPGTWIFDGDGATGGVGHFVVGPATPPLGIGSARMMLDGTTTSRERL